MATAFDASVPRFVGRYVLYGEIASGGMATVHFGRLIGPAGFARPVAIKRLHAQFARDPDFVKMFLDEARLAARIAHPNVVPTLDVVADNNEVFLVMEYVRGATLAHLARTVRRAGQRIQTEISAGIVSGMLQGLHAAHEAKDDRGARLDLVHRDVSPQNALVGTDGVTRLLDFGVAKAAGRLQTTRDGQLKGKLAYMAPEQVRGEALTRRTDVYAASVVLWEVLTGHRLFYANNEANVLAKVLSLAVPPPSQLIPGLPEALDRVVLRGLERDPAKRFATAREMAAEIDACLTVASPNEIGDWVEQTASDELRERATHIESIERSAAESRDSLPQVADIPGLGAPDAPTPVGHRARDLATAVLEQAKPQADASELSNAAFVPASLPMRPPGKRAVAIATAAVGAVLVGFLVLLLSLSSRPRSLPAQGAPAAQAIATSGSAPTPIAPIAAPVAPPVMNVEDIAAAPASAAPQANRPRRAASQAAPAPSVPPAGAAAGADCNPPYTADAKGHIHFKPSCI